METMLDDSEASDRIHVAEEKVDGPSSLAPIRGERSGHLLLYRHIFAIVQEYNRRMGGDRQIFDPWRAEPSYNCSWQLRRDKLCLQCGILVDRRAGGRLFGNLSLVQH